MQPAQSALRAVHNTQVGIRNHEPRSRAIVAADGTLARFESVTCVWYRFDSALQAVIGERRTVLRGDFGFAQHAKDLSNVDFKRLWRSTGSASGDFELDRHDGLQETFVLEQASRRAYAAHNGGKRNLGGLNPS